MLKNLLKSTAKMMLLSSPTGRSVILFVENVSATINKTIKAAPRSFGPWSGGHETLVFEIFTDSNRIKCNLLDIKQVSYPHRILPVDHKGYINLFQAIDEDSAAPVTILKNQQIGEKRKQNLAKGLNSAEKNKKMKPKI